MWSKRAAAVELAIAAFALTASACSSAKPKPSTTPMTAPRFSKRLDPTDLIPADLDLVVRLDLGRMRDGLGPIAVDELMKRAVEGRGDTIVKGLLPCADVVWIGLRLADLDGADHVAVVEGHDCDVITHTAEWKRVPAANGDLTIFDRTTSAPRDGTAKVVMVGDRAVVLASPVEAPSVERLLRDGGPDLQHGEPKAEGIVSVDVRGHRLPPELEKKYPAIGSLIAGIHRVRAIATLGESGVDLEAEVTNKSEPEAARALKVLLALRDNVESDSARLVLAGIKIEQVDATVRLRWTVPSRVVLGALAPPAPTGGGGPAKGSK